MTWPTEPNGRLEHAEAHERLADLALEPGALDRLGDPEHNPLAAHVAGCESCRRDVEAWRRTDAALLRARGPAGDRVELAELANDEPITAPPELRGIVLEAARSESARRATPAAGRAVVPARLGPSTGPTVVRRSSFGRRLGRLLPLVAVLAIAAVGAGVIVDQSTRLERIGRETALLEGATASLERILRDPDHEVLDLRGADGRASGSLTWSSHDLVVLTTALEPPPPDRLYRCWIERDGKRSPVGVMWFAGDTAFWNGTLDDWATTSFERGGTFGVSLEPIAGSTGNPAVLVAELPG